MRQLHARHDKDLFGYSFVDEDPIADLHRSSILSSIRHRFHPSPPVIHQSLWIKAREWEPKAFQQDISSKQLRHQPESAAT
jgi:hypothetical protein